VHYRGFPRFTREELAHADLVVLSDNLATVDPMAIKDIKVLETIVESKSVYLAPNRSGCWRDDNAFVLNERVAFKSFASKLAPTGDCVPM
jgi:hypothetical protein